MLGSIFACLTEGCLGVHSPSAWQYLLVKSEYEILRAKGIPMTLDMFSSAVGSVTAGTNGTMNATTVFDSLIWVASTGKGASQYSSLFLPVAAFILIGLVFIIVDSIRGLMEQTGELHWSDWKHNLVWSLRFVITIVLMCLAAYATDRSLTLRTGFEVEAWCVSFDEDRASLGQIGTILMSTSLILAALNVIGGEFRPLPDSHRFGFFLGKHS